MRFITILFCFSWVTVIVFGASLPTTFTKCDYKNSDFNDCLGKAIQNGVNQLSQSFKEIGLPNLDPLFIPELTIGAGKGPVGFSQKYFNLKMFGFKDAKVIKAEFNNEKKYLKLDAFIDLLNLKFNNEIKGNLFVLPIYGNGPGTIRIHKAQFNLTLNLNEFTKKDAKHYKVKDFQLIIRPKSIDFNLKNLFDGDENLTNNVNQVMNENWYEMFLDIGPSYEEAFGKIFVSIFNEMAKRVSAEELFGIK